MKKLNLIIADDEPRWHKNIRETLDSLNIKYDILKDFDNTDDLMNYLYDITNDENLANEGKPDILFLDHFFQGNGLDGLDCVEEIKEICPNMPILLLTTSEYGSMVSEKKKEIGFGYLQKPVKSSDLLCQIEDIFEKIEYREIADQLLADVEKKLFEKEMQLESMTEPIKILPQEMLQLIQNIFPDVEFDRRAFDSLANKFYDMTTWNRLVRCLKLIDWKNEQNAPAGAKVQKYKDATRNIWEYRFSQAGRIFVQRRENDKPLVLAIDPTHSYSDTPLF